MTSDIVSTNPVVIAVIEGSAPRPAQVAASKGILPLPQADLLEILATFADGVDDELKTNATETLRAQDHVSLEQTIKADNVPASALAFYVSEIDMPQTLHEAILTNPRTPPAAVARFAAATPNGLLLELIAVNQQLLIQTPGLIDAIIGNPNRTAEAERRAREVKREFFEKERGSEQIVNELRARGQEAAAEFFENSDSGLSIDDAILLAEHIEVPDSETDDSWLALEWIEEIYEETEEQRQATVTKILGELQIEGQDVGAERLSMINRIMKMGVKDRVRLGMKGDREARNVLIRDPNRLVSAAVVQNPRITEQEVESIAAMRSLSEDILRAIASNRQWSRSYPVMHNLARNPRTPMANVLTILSRLQLRDLGALSKNRNVSDAVRRQALRLVTARTGGAKH
jgi:hypothetical protein